LIIGQRFKCNREITYTPTLSLRQTGVTSKAQTLEGK